MLLCDRPSIFRKNDREAPELSLIIFYDLASETTYVSRCQSTWLDRIKQMREIGFTEAHQCKNHGPGLFVVKRNVTLSPSSPVETTSRRTFRSENTWTYVDYGRTYWMRVIIHLASSTSDDIKGVLHRKG